MGVKGLWWFLVNHGEKSQQTVFRSFDLLKEAASSPEGLTLIVDFYPFEYWIISQVHRDILLEKSETNPWVTVSGGEYEYFGAYALKLVKALADCNIKLVIVVNAGRCSSSGQMDFKYARWLQTDLRDMAKVSDVLLQIEDSEDLKQFQPARDSKSPTLLPLEVVERFRQAGCEILCSLDGETDPFIAKLYEERRAFAILSNDSDFLLFKSTRYINLDEHFDTNGCLAAFLSSGGYGKLDELLVKCVFSEDVYAALEIPNVEAACDLSFVLGNDVSKQFPDLYKRLNLLRFSVKGVASRLARYGPLTRNHVFKSVFNDPHVKEAHRLTHELYKPELSTATLADMGLGEIHDMNQVAIRKAVLECRIAAPCLAMSRGFYWQDAKIVETNDNLSSLYSAESACFPLRLALYRILISDPTKDTIVEYRPLKTSQLTDRCVVSLNEAVEKKPMLADLPKFYELAEMSRHKRLEIFDRIVNECFSGSHFEDASESYRIYQRFPEWTFAFRVYVCRFIWLANNNGKNLQLTHPEMESIIASVFAMSGPSFDFGLAAACKPTRRSLTVGSFVQVAYRYLFNYLAKMLELANSMEMAKLPLPAAFFSGSTFTAMFCHQSGDNKIETEMMAKVRKVRTSILDRHTEVTEAVLA